MRKSTYRNNTWWIFLAPSMIGVIIFNIVPFIDVLRRSVLSSFSGQFVGMDNYKKVFRTQAFQLAGVNTVKFLLFCIPLLLVVSLCLALVIHQSHNPFILKTISLLPMAIPVAAIVLVWKIIFFEHGLIGRLLMCFGFDKINFFHSEAAMGVLVFTYIWRNCGYGMILWLSGLNSINRSLYEAAGVDGASSFSKFRYITMPMLMPFASAIFVLSILNAFKVFREAYLVSGDYPHESIYMLQHLLNNWFVTLDMSKISASAVILTAVVGSLAVALQKIWGKDVT